MVDAPSVFQPEIAFIAGIDANGAVAPYSYETWRSDDDYPSNPANYGDTALAWKWGAPIAGTSATVSYWFDTSSNWTDVEKNAFVGGMALWSAVANVTFVASASQDAANFRIVRGSDSQAYFSGGGRDEIPVGSTTLGTPVDDPGSQSRLSMDTSVPSFGPIAIDFVNHGGFPFSTVVHELGHALGLGHGGPYDGTYDALTQQFSAYDTKQWSIMSYILPWVPGKYNPAYTDTFWGLINNPDGTQSTGMPVTPMALDIVAIQRLYGAPVSGPLVSGGQVFGYNTNIEGTLRPYFDFTVNHSPIVTLWDGGVGNTLDLSGYNFGSKISLQPGTFSSTAGITNNIGIAFGTIIETAIGGDGDDWIIGSDIANVLRGNAGNDIFTGGAGADLIYFGAGQDRLVDQLADMNGDSICGVKAGDFFEIGGGWLARSSLTLSGTGDSATFAWGGNAFQVEGNLTGGAFMFTLRGTDASAHTAINFVPILPALHEGVAVAPANINGIANEAFLTGDGLAAYSVELDAAISTYANMLGVYVISAEGILSNVHIVFENTLSASIGQSIAIATPGDGERVGFFLIQDGASLYGTLADDLSFQDPYDHSPFNVHSGDVPLLFSQSAGYLTAASVFHSLADINPDKAIQALSGTDAAGDTLFIGFEDIRNGSGDNDFQDVVIAVHVSQDGLFLI